LKFKFGKIVDWESVPVDKLFWEKQTAKFQSSVKKQTDEQTGKEIRYLKNK
jgi:hypothetical protein